jgi:hypothetical protein
VCSPRSKFGRPSSLCMAKAEVSVQSDASAPGCLWIRSRFCHVPDSDPCGCRSPDLSIEINLFLDFIMDCLARLAAVKPSCLSSKWQPEQWRYLAWRVRCIAFGSRYMKRDPHPSTTTTKISKIRFSHGVKWASLGRGAAPCHWHQGQAMWELAGWTTPE